MVATAVEVGGGLRELSVDGIAVLDGYDDDEMCGAARGTPLVPWPNRIRDGAYTFGGEPQQLALSEPTLGNAIHGLTRWQAWTAVEQRSDRVVLGTTVNAQPGYPFTIAVTATYALTADGVDVELTAVNRGAGPAPFAAGHHPYVTADPTRTIDDCLVELGAAKWLPNAEDGRQIPTGELRDVAGDTDFRRPRRLGSLRLDTAFTDLDRDDRGRAWVTLESGRRRVRVWMGPEFTHVMLFTGDALSESERRWGLGVEPMTCAPNAFATGEGIRVLEPGESFAARWGISVEAV